MFFGCQLVCQRFDLFLECIYVCVRIKGEIYREILIFISRLGGRFAYGDRMGEYAVGCQGSDNAA